MRKRITDKSKIILESVVFLVLLVFLLNRAYDAVRYKDTGSGGGMDNYYASGVPVDVVAYGSSHAGCTIDNRILWKEFGIPSYTLSAGSQSIDGTYYFLSESIRVHKPRVALVETFMFSSPDTGLDSIYRTTLTGHWSLNYVDYIMEQNRLHHFDHGTVEELLLRLPIVHDRYRELGRADFINDGWYQRGYRGSNEQSPVEPPALTDRRAPLPDITRFYMQKMADLCKKEGVHLIFFNAPYSATEDEIAIQNSIMDFAAEQGIPFLGFNHMDDEIGIDYTTDMRESSHLNDLGAARVTRYLGSYLKKNVQLQDRSSDPGYQAWDVHARYLSAREDGYALSGAQTLPAYLSELSQFRETYTIVLALQGNYRALGDDAFANELELLGISQTQYLNGGVFVLQNGTLSYSSEGSDAYLTTIPLQNHLDLTLYREEGLDHILLSGRDYAGDINGLSMLVFDETCSYLVDSIYVNVYDGLDVRRSD